MPISIERDLELNLSSLLENLEDKEVYDVIHSLAIQVWKKGKTIEIIDEHAQLSEILQGIGISTIKKILGEPKNEKEMETSTSRWLREEKSCEKVRTQIKIAGRTADVVGGHSKYYGYSREVIAVELKCRKSGIDRAIGQITTYLEGAHFVYLAISPYVYYQLSKRELRSLNRKLIKNKLGLVIINKRGDITYELIQAEKSEDIEDEDLEEVMKKIDI